MKTASWLLSFGLVCLMSITSQACPLTARLAPAPIQGGAYRLTYVRCGMFRRPCVLVPKKIVLFDGTDLSSFCNAKGEDKLPGSWSIDDDLNLHFKPSNLGRGDIFTKQQFGNFTIHWEWRIAQKGNSGVKYHLNKFGNSWLGPEYQILDDFGHSNGKNPKTSAASLYEFFAPAESKTLNPVGEFNHSMIVVRGKHAEHWLNGKKVVEYTVGSDEWNETIKTTKFRDVKGFAENAAGPFLFQDHGDEVWYRNIWIEDWDHCDLVPVRRCGLRR